MAMIGASTTWGSERSPRVTGHDWSATFTTAMLCTLIVLMIVPEGFDYASLKTGYMPGSGSLLTRFLWLALLGGAAALAIWRATVSLNIVRKLNPFLIAFCVLAFVSIAWSLEPRLTLRRDLRLLTFVLIAIAFCSNGWHPRRLQNVLRPLLTCVIVGSLIFGLAAPTLAIHSETAPELLNAWRGLANHKNSLGAIAGVTVLFWLHGLLAREMRPWRALPWLIAAGMALWLSSSATAMVATLFAAAFLCLLTHWPRALQPYLKYAVLFVAAAILVYALAMLRLIPGQGILLTPVAAITGDTSFTGRSEIWDLITDQIRERPWLGVGYGSYWVGPDPASPSFEFVLRMSGFYPGSAHNGYLDVVNDLGWVGLLFLIGFLIVHLKQTLKLWIADRPQAALFLTLFMQQAISNLSESHWFSVLSVHFVITILIGVSLARHLLEHEFQWRRAMAAKMAASLAPPSAPPDAPALVPANASP